MRSNFFQTYNWSFRRETYFFLASFTSQTWNLKINIVWIDLTRMTSSVWDARRKMVVWNNLAEVRTWTRGRSDKFFVQVGQCSKIFKFKYEKIAFRFADKNFHHRQILPISFISVILIRESKFHFFIFKFKHFWKLFNLDKKFVQVGKMFKQNWNLYIYETRSKNIFFKS